jgi:hypothetical protein
MLPGSHAWTRESPLTTDDVPLASDRRADVRSTCSPLPVSSRFITPPALDLGSCKSGLSRNASQGSWAAQSAAHQGAAAALAHGADFEAAHADAAGAETLRSAGSIAAALPATLRRVADHCFRPYASRCNAAGHESAAREHTDAQGTGLSSAVAAARALASALCLPCNVPAGSPVTLGPPVSTRSSSPAEEGRSRARSTCSSAATDEAAPIVQMPAALLRTLPQRTIAQLLDNSADFSSVHEFELVLSPAATADSSQEGGEGDAAAGEDAHASAAPKVLAPEPEPTSRSRPGRYDCLEVRVLWYRLVLTFCGCADCLVLASARGGCTSVAGTK